MTLLKTTSEFLTVADIYIRVKITKAEEAASQFTSQNDYYISLKKSYTSYIIPCLLGIRKFIEEVLEESNIKNYDAKEAFDLLIFKIEQKHIQIEALKQNSTDPIVMAGLSLVQGVYKDVIEEIEPILHKTVLFENEKEEKPFQEIDQTPLSNPINETPVSTYDSSSVLPKYRQDIVKNTVTASDPNKQEIPHSQNSAQSSIGIIPALEVIVLPIIGIVFIIDKNPIIYGLGIGLIIASVTKFINLFNNSTKTEKVDIPQVNLSTSFTIEDKPELFNILILQSSARYIFLCSITSGLYIFYWFYKHWFFIKKLQKLNISSVLCAAFPGITIYSLTKRIFAIAKQKGYSTNIKPVNIFFLQTFMSMSVGRLSGLQGLIPLLFIFYPTIYIHESLTYFAKKTYPNYQEISFFSGGMVGWIIFGIIIWILAIIGSYN